MRVLVTGAAGYIGSAVTHRLIGAGHEVVALDSLKYGTRDAVHPKAEFIQHDLASSASLWQKTVKSVEAVIHLAAESLIPLSVVDPGLFYRVNVGGGICLLDAMVDHGVDRLIFSSTSSVYGDNSGAPLHEEHPTCPSSVYGASKLAFEQALEWYWRTHGVHSTIFRYFNVNGGTKYCRERPYHQTRIIPTAFKVAVGEMPCFELYGVDYPTLDGTCVRDYLHVHDVATAHLSALDMKEATIPQVFNLGLGCGHSNWEVLKLVERITGKDISIKECPRREGDPAALVCNPAKAKRALGWTPEYNHLEAIVRSAWKHFRQVTPCWE